MKRSDFERERSPIWVKFDQALQRHEKKQSLPEETIELPKLYREVCHDLTLAKHRLYGARMSDYLNGLVMRGYNALYSQQRNRFESLFDYVFVRIPCAVRSEMKIFWACALAFLIPYLAMWASAWGNVSWIQSLLGPDGMSSMESMYGKGGSLIEHARSEHGSNFMMFCHYVYNNISIDFRIFAGGVFFGIGSLFFLVFNGLYIGAAAGYIHYACDTEKFYTFVVGHSSFELIGMVLAGMAGMLLGLSLLNPGRLSRRDALSVAGKKALPLIVGGALMTFVAALIEGFWSAQPASASTKYIVGACVWAVCVSYLVFCGRSGEYGS